MKKTHDRLAPETQLLVQRIAVAVFLALAAVFAGLDYEQGTREAGRGEFVAPPQLRPAELVNSAELERALERLMLADGGRLVVDSALEAALSRSLAHVPADRPLASETMERYRLLIEKSLPEPAGREFFSLFARYAAYRLAANDLLFALEPETLEQEVERWSRLRALRREHFPLEADALFGKEETLAEYTLTLRRIEGDATLTEAQKTSERERVQAELDSKMARFP
ncbi:MAG TPA: lipase secretion chaperone [Steroidobacteraceae bacterium]